jgi:hypothetical protein
VFEGSDNEGETKFGETIESKWGWYNTIYMLANENILNINKITKQPVYEVFTFLAYKQDYNQKIEDERRQYKI